MRKNLIKLVVLSFLTVFYFNIGVESASAAYACNGNVRCADASFNGTAQYVASKSVYFSKGETIAYGWENDSEGLMQVEFFVSKDGKQMSKALSAPRFGQNWGTYPVPESGYYYLFAACEGGSDTRCDGGGLISIY